MMLGYRGQPNPRLRWPRHHRALPSVEPICRQPAADARGISGLSRARCPERGQRARADHDAVGHAAAATRRRLPGDEHPQYLIAALAGLAEAGKPVPRPVQQLCRICAGAEP